METHATIGGRSDARRIADALSWIGGRLRKRPDTEHEMTINRLVLSGLTLIYLVVASGFGNASAAGMLDAAGPLLALYWTCSFALFGHILYRPGVSVARRLIGMLIDFGIFSYCMHIGGEAMAPLYPIYLWVIFGNGFRFGLTYLAAAAACGVVSFTIVVLTTEFWHSHLPLSAGLTSGLILLPIYVSSLIRKLSDAKRQAEEASKAKSLFLASVSHELRTPLSAVIGLSDLLRDTRLDAEQRDMTQTIGQSGRTLLNLINTILDFSRIEAGRMPSRVEPFDLYGLLGGIRRLLLVQVQAKGLRFALHVTSRTPQHLFGEKRQLEDILVNLASNAVKFTTAGHVVIAVDAVARFENRLRLRVEVTDTGIGIVEESQKRIFESFTQANEKIIDQFGGTGLGLAIVKQLVELQGGAIGVISAPAQGSTFWFEIDIGVQEDARNLPLSAAEPIVLLSTNVTTRALLRASLPAPQFADTAAEAAALLDAARQDGIRQPIAILELPDDADAATALTRRLAGDDQATAALLIAVTDSDHTGMLPEPQRSLFITTLPRPIDSAGVGVAIAVANGCRHGADMSNVTTFPAPQLHRRLSILVAEDNRTNQKVISKILEKVGHDVTIVEHGEAALEALHEHDFDLVLMDINMPVMNGIEATKLYRFGALGQKHTPIVALTADATVEVSERCERAGMDGCLTKPIEPARLIEVIDRVVRSKHDAAAKAIATEEPDAGTAAVETGSAPLAVDAYKLEELKRIGGEDFVNDLVQQFLDDSIDVLCELADAVRSGDVDTFRERAHALRSGAANVGARGVYEKCLAWRQIDAETLHNDGSDHVSELEAEFKRVREALESKAAA
ncbi:MAG: response regulator [Rhizobiales bacterium]|nr:response regulator [Hyphomicrobiales bacterium]